MTFTAPLPPVGTAVVLPGTGSDEVFVRAAFAGPLAAARLRLVAPRPRPGRHLAEHLLAEFDAAAHRYGPIVAGGISLGAHLAAEWAAAHPDRCAGLLLALPGWSGSDAAAPAVLTAEAGAAAVAARGIDEALAAATAGVPGWLAAELDRAWRRAGPGLAESLRAAARRPAPTPAVLRGITAPAGVVGCVGDPVHPVEVARRWADALPAGRLRTVTFTRFGADRAALGRAALLGLGGRAVARVQDEVDDGDADDHGTRDRGQAQR